MWIVRWGLGVSGAVFVVLLYSRQAQRRRRGVATVGTHGSIPRDRFNAAALRSQLVVESDVDVQRQSCGRSSAIGYCVCIGRYECDVGVDQPTPRGFPSAF